MKRDTRLSVLRWSEALLREASVERLCWARIAIAFAFVLWGYFLLALFIG